jgi:uncharacterized protein (DUF58 family)
VDELGDTTLLEPAAVARLMRHFLHARSPMEGNVTGQHKSPHRGSSVEFAEYRKYVPGDDIRRLDWRVYGRTDRFYMREFEADTNLRCYMVLDTSASMGFREKETSKLEYGRRLVATLAYLLVRQGDAVGLQCFGNKVVHDIPPRRNPAHLRHIFKLLGEVEPHGETALVSMLHEFAEKVRQRALVLIFSDFFCDLEALLNCFQHLRFKKHDFAVFHLLAPSELDFKFDRPVRFLDMESPGTSLLAEPAVIRNHYLAQVKSFLDGMRQGCNQFNADYRRVLVDMDYEKVLADFLSERARNKGFARGK